MDLEHVRSRFIKHFDGLTGSVYASPGRINLIGEHTDYNGGFVFPGAIDKGMIAELRPNGTDKVRAYSIDMKDYVEFGLNEEDAPRTSWARYIFGVCREMIKRGVAVRENDERIALFAHAGFGGAFLSHVLGIPYPQYGQTFDLCHSSLTVIEFREKHGVCVPRVLTLSNDAHLYHDHLPVNDRPRF